MTLMSGYCLLNAAISRPARSLSGVQLHQWTVPEVAEPPSLLLELLIAAGTSGERENVGDAEDDSLGDP